MTYGRSNAGLVLQDLLNKSDISKRKRRLVGSLICDLHNGLDFIKRGKEPGIYERIWVLWVKEIEKQAQSLDLPKKIEDYLLATIKGVSRQHRRIFHILYNKEKLGAKRINKLKAEFIKHDKRFGVLNEKPHKSK